MKMLAVTNTPRSHVAIKHTQASLRSSLPSSFAARPHHKMYNLHRASSAAGSAPVPEDEPTTSAAASGTSPSSDLSDSSSGFQKLAAWWKGNQQKSAELRKRLVSLGPAAVLAYGKTKNICFYRAATASSACNFFL
jgi:hypothetical protein